MLASFRNVPRQKILDLNLFADWMLLFIGSFVSAKPATMPGVHWMIALGMATGSMLVWFLSGRILRHYDAYNGRGTAGDVALTAVQMGTLLLILWILRHFVPHYAASSNLGAFAAIVAPSILWMRLSIGVLKKAEPTAEHVLVVGIGALGRHTGIHIAESKKRAVLSYLRFETEVPHGRLSAPLVGTVHDLEACLQKHVVSEVYLAAFETGAAAESQHAEMQQCIRVCERFGIPFALPAGRFRFARARPLHGQAVTPDGYIHYSSVCHKPLQRALKRAFDIVASAAALAVLSPLMIAVALLIKVTSRGPILFKQPRAGLHGRPFHMLKFRSMVVDAEKLQRALLDRNEQTGPVFKLKNDPRVTWIGRILRKFSIDELPQLVNVMRGEMALVGPRPPLPTEVQRYEGWQRRRLSVRPGLTCVWQVSGRNQITFEEWMYLDMQYIDHWSLSQDFQLILKTVPVVLTGRGAS